METFDNRQDEANEELERRLAAGEPVALNVPPMTPADYGAQAARTDKDVFARLLDAAEKTMHLWIMHGLGDDASESEPVYMALEQAILDARQV